MAHTPEGKLINWIFFVIIIYVIGKVLNWW